MPEGFNAEGATCSGSTTRYLHRCATSPQIGRLRSQGVGAFQVSSYRKNGAVTDADLSEFAGDIPLTAVSLGRATGFRARFSEGETFWTKWWLRAGRQMIHATYNCPVSERGREDAALTSMLESLIPEYGEHEA